MNNYHIEIPQGEWSSFVFYTRRQNVIPLGMESRLFYIAAAGNFVYKGTPQAAADKKGRRTPFPQGIYLFFTKNTIKQLKK